MDEKVMAEFIANTIPSTQITHFKKILPHQYYQITYELIQKVVNLNLKLNIVDYDQFKSQTLAYSLEFTPMSDDEHFYFECHLNDIEYYDIIEIDKQDARYLTFGYVKCEIVGVTGVNGLDRILLKVLDKKDLE